MIVGENVRLVPIEPQHLDYIMEHFNNPEMRNFLGGYIPVTRNMEVEWIQSAEEGIRKRTGFNFAIEKLPKGDMIGSLSLESIDWVSRSCHLGIAIYEKDNWSKGLLTAAEILDNVGHPLETCLIERLFFLGLYIL